MNRSSSDRSDKPRRPGEQPAGNPQQEAASGEAKQYGEGNYKATRDYNRGLKEHLQSHDVEREARDAAPRSGAEEKDLQEAERKGRSKSRGEDAGADRPADPDEPEAA